MKNARRPLNMDIPVPLPVFMALCEHRERTGCRQEIFEMAGVAIQEWLAAQAQLASTGSGQVIVNGYQWKSVFLPDGTVLRTVFKGVTYHAAVERGSILFHGQAVSPSGFLNSVGGSVRNAWTSITVAVSTAERLEDCG